MKFINIAFSPALLLSVGTLLSYVLGVVRDIFFARNYGASSITDTYFSAFLIPDIIMMICVSSALMGIAIPLFMQERERDTEKGYALYGVLFACISSLFVGISIIGIIFTPEIFSFFYPKQYANNPEMLIHLARIFFGTNILFGISNFIGSFLMAHKHFLSTALAPIVYNVGIIIGVIFFAEQFGIYAAAYGALGGAMMHLAFRIIEYGKNTEKFPLSFSSFNWNSHLLHQLLQSMVFRWLTVAAFPLTLYGISLFASFEKEGLYTIFLYARNIESAPVMIFGIAITTALFPVLSQFFAEKSQEKFIQSFWEGGAKIIFWTVPMAVGVFFFGAGLLGEIYSLSSDKEKLEWLTQILCIISFIIPFEALTSLFARTFNAMGDTKSPLILSSISLTGITIFLLFSHYNPIFSGSTSLAVAYLLGFILSTFSGIFLLSKSPLFTKDFSLSITPQKSQIFSTMILSLIASIAMASVFYIIQNYFSVHFNNEELNSYILYLAIQFILIPFCGMVIFFSVFFVAWKTRMFSRIKTML